MKIGILEAGLPPRALTERFGRYDAMTARLLGPEFETSTFRVHSGELPDGPERFAGFVVTGSSAGVYDDLPWIAPLAGFLRSARGRAKLVGICFGHQIMAEAFGGRAEKSDRGWGLGLHRYAVAARAPWMDDAGSIAIAASHQDQVTRAPPDADVSLSSLFAPIAGLTYRDGSAISIQGHPEFEIDFARALLARHVDRAGHEAVEAADATFTEPSDNARLGHWIGAFLRAEPAKRT